MLHANGGNKGAGKIAYLVIRVNLELGDIVRFSDIPRLFFELHQFSHFSPHEVGRKYEPGHKKDEHEDDA